MCICFYIMILFVAIHPSHVFQSKGPPKGHCTDIYSEDIKDIGLVVGGVLGSGLVFGHKILFCYVFSYYNH